MKVLISGSSGLIGTALAASLESDGHEVVRLIRRMSAAGPVFEDASSARSFEGADAAVNLCGFGIMRRWTASVKAEIERSRVESARFFASVFPRLSSPPNVFLCASATGFYGDRGDEVLTEESTAGQGFLSEVASRWEAAANASEVRRVVNLRFGVVLSKSGGALKMARVPFFLGLGAKVGDGSAYVSWISLADTVRAIRFAMDNSSISGPVNVVSPSPVRGAVFSRALGNALRRPVFLSVGNRLIKFVLGEMGGEVILSGARVLPQKLLKAGFNFSDGDLEDFLRLEIGGARHG